MALYLVDEAVAPRKQLSHDLPVALAPKIHQSGIDRKDTGSRPSTEKGCMVERAHIVRLEIQFGKTPGSC